MGVASTNRTDKFWHIGSAEEYSSEEFDGWGVRSYTRVWQSYLQAVLNGCYFWFRQCGDVIIYVIPHYLYSDIIIVWMWYSTRIWVIWSTTVIIHLTLWISLRGNQVVSAGMFPWVDLSTAIWEQRNHNALIRDWDEWANSSSPATSAMFVVIKMLCTR